MAAARLGGCPVRRAGRALGPSALAAGRGGFAPTEVVHVAIDESRRVTAPAGVVVHRVKGLGVRTHWRTAPPRMRAGEAVLDAALAEDEFGQVAVLARAVQERVVTPQEISSVLESRTRVPRRRFLLALLDDLASGTDSVLEHGYLTRVERAHGLPRGRRQGRVVGLREHRDVLYEEARAIVELDSRAYHSLARQRYADLERDTSALAAGYQTVRIGWGQVFGTPCRTAALLADLFGQRGWGGTARRCPACP